LFWWSAEISSIFQPLANSPESSIAIWAAADEPGPPMSRRDRIDRRDFDLDGLVELTLVPARRLQ